MPELTTRGTVADWCRAFRIKPEWICGWVLVCAESYATQRRYTSATPADEIRDDTAVQYLKVFYTRPEAYDADHPAERPGKVYATVLAGIDVYWLPGATRPKHGLYVTDAESARFTTEAGTEGCP